MSIIHCYPCTLITSEETYGESSLSCSTRKNVNLFLEVCFPAAQITHTRHKLKILLLYSTVAYCSFRLKNLELCGREQYVAGKFFCSFCDPMISVKGEGVGKINLYFNIYIYISSFRIMGFAYCAYPFVPLIVKRIIFDLLLV